MTFPFVLWCAHHTHWFFSTNWKYNKKKPTLTRLTTVTLFASALQLFVCAIKIFWWWKIPWQEIDKRALHPMISIFPECSGDNEKGEKREERIVVKWGSYGVKYDDCHRRWRRALLVLDSVSLFCAIFQVDFHWFFSVMPSFVFLWRFVSSIHRHLCVLTSYRQHNSIETRLQRRKREKMRI